MKIEVNQISEVDGLTVHHVYPKGEPDLVSEDVFLSVPSDITIRAERKGEEVELAGHLEATVQISCDRCLKPSSVQVDQDFELLYIPPLKPGAPDDEKELGRDDLSIAFYQDQVIDVDDLVREQIELALPMSRLCTEECQGLCPHCGANLNEKRCGCEEKDTDPRWFALKALKSEELE
jgi:uncharacterized protein